MLLEQTQMTTPYHLGDGLVLRFVTADDVERLAQLNGRIHGGDHFNPYVAQWTREFASSSHPTCGPSNVTIVEDTRTGQIVSSMCLIPQTWTYDDIPFKVGRPEAVGTDPDYRRRGLVRAQFDVLHHKSDEAGHLAQGISGVPWYYRQFGYEYALDLDGGRWVYPSLIAPLKEGEVEAYRFRPMMIDDVPLAMKLYERCCARSLVACPRPEWWWRRILHDVSRDSVDYRSLHVIETLDGHAMGYVAYSHELWGTQFQIHEFNIMESESLRAVLPSLLRWLKPIAEAEALKQGIDSHVLYFKFGAEHPAFEAAPDRFHRVRPPYAWYLRVADVAKFLNHIAPALEARLARSGLTSYSGEIKATEYVRGFKLIIEHGQVRAETWRPDGSDNAMFPPYTFCQLLFGRRSLSDLRYIYPDCLLDDEVAAVLDTLFPERHSNVLPMG